MIGENDCYAGRKIFSNYPIYGYPVQMLDINDMLSIVNMEMEVSPKTILIQEASKWFDSRRAMRKENVLLSSFTGQSGKREIDIYYDDQFPSRIDPGLRDITDTSFIAQALPSHPEKPVYFRYHQYGGYFQYDMNKSIPLPAYHMEQYYNMYDTRAPTRPLEMIKSEEKDQKSHRK